LNICCSRQEPRGVSKIRLCRSVTGRECEEHTSTNKPAGRRTCYTNQNSARAAPKTISLLCAVRYLRIADDKNAKMLPLACNRCGGACRYGKEDTQAHRLICPPPRLRAPRAAPLLQQSSCQDCGPDNQTAFPGCAQTRNGPPLPTPTFLLALAA